MNWKKEIPTEIGHYWFYGERYKPHGNDELYELILCEAIVFGDGSIMITGDGQFIHESEFGKDWAFAKADLSFPRPKFNLVRKKGKQ